MSVKWTAVFGLLILTVTGGCAAESGSADYAVVSALNATIAATSQESETAPAIETKSARHIIRQGELRFETTDQDATRTAILGFVEAHHGYLADDGEQRTPSTLEQTMKIRVPAEEFDGLLKDVSAGVTHFDRREIQAIDVTEEYVDMDARLTTKKETESRYRELLKQANGVEEILKIEEQIDKLRGDIESTEGRLRLLRDRVSYSTLNVSFYESHANATGFWLRVKSNFYLGWQAVVEFTIAVVVLWPLILLTSLALLVIWWFNRKSVQQKIVTKVTS